MRLIMFEVKNKLMKYYILILSLIFSCSLSAQKNSGRKETKKGNKAYQAEKYEQAAADYQEAIKVNPRAKTPNYNLGNTLYRQKKWDEAIKQQQHYLMLEQLDPMKMSAAWHNLGNTFLQKKQLQEAIEAYKMALRLNPNDEETRYNLAVAQKIRQDIQNNQDQDKNQDKEKDKDKQDQQKEQQPQNQENNKEKKPEQQQEPEQMSRENARQILQAIEQDEKETQERVKQIRAQERKQQAEDNRRQDKDW